MSRNNSSLAFEDLHEQSLNSELEMGFEPELHVCVKSRHMSLERLFSLDLLTDIEDVIQIGGRFTVSF